MNDKKQRIRYSNIFIKNEKYPDVSKVLFQEYKNTFEVKDECLYVLDTNVLLLPFETNQKDLAAIKTVFESLISDNRLFLPSQVVREFADNRGEKLKDIYDYLNSRPQINIPKIDFKLNEFSPLLKSFDEFKKIQEIEKEITSLVNNELKGLNTEYHRSLNKLKSIAENWRWNDPVSNMYKELFNSNLVVEIDDFEQKRSDIEKEHKKRIEHAIPPAFKDVNKEDYGIGDYLIWLTILQLAKSTTKDIVFVTQETKNDWIDKSNDTLLYPRYELCYEFANYTNGKSFNIITLSKLLKMYDVDETTVDNIERREKTLLQRKESIHSFYQKSEQFVYEWLLTTYSEKEIKFNDIFPDYIIRNKEHKIGVEVKATKELSFFVGIIKKTLEKINIQTLIEDGFTEMYIFVVVTFSLDIDDRIKKRIKEYIADKEANNIELGVYVGNLLNDEIIKL